MTRSLNKVILIGNLTRDPELRYTPQGTAVCTFSVATNRQWTTDSGEKKEDVEYTRVVAWQKLGELCSQLLAKGRKVYVEGRLQTRKWTGQDNVERSTTEVVISDMLILDSKGATGESFDSASDIPDDLGDISALGDDSQSHPKQVKASTKKVKEEKSVDVDPSTVSEDEDIPF